MGEGDNALNVRAFEAIFARQVVQPLAKRIARFLNYELFGEKALSGVPLSNVDGVYMFDCELKFVVAQKYKKSTLF